MWSKVESTSAGEGRSKSEPPVPTNAPTSRVRALSGRIFFRPSLDEKNKAEAVNAISKAAPSDGEPPDPFNADTSNYYNPAAGFPKTPPRIGHVRSDSVGSSVSVNSGRPVSATSHRSGMSRSSLASATQTRRSVAEDEVITALRTQLAFHQELATQYELDIRARDAHTALLSQKLQAHEAEAERRARAMRGMHSRVAELERAAAALEEQAERSALESFEAGVLDGANGDALRSLHQQISDLERERTEMENRDRQTKEENAKLMVDLARERTETANREKQAKEESAKLTVDLERARAEMVNRERQAKEESAKLMADLARERTEVANRERQAKEENVKLMEELQQREEALHKLKVNVRALKQQSADQDVKILQLEKLHGQDTEDKLGLNIALDSKQQELELLKRSMGVRGTAGATPAAPTRAGVRRDSAAFRTPMPIRPSSSLSDGARHPLSSLSDTERSGKLTGGTPWTVKPMFGRTSTRPNIGSMPTVPSTVKKAPRFSDSSLSAPPGRSRASTAGSVSAKTPARPGVAAVTRRVVSPTSTTIGRRASIAISGIESMSDSTSSALSDKENETPRARHINATAVAARRMSMQPLAVPA